LILKVGVQPGKWAYLISPSGVRKVQGLINNNLHLLICTNKLVMDGRIGNIDKSNTIKAIKTYQMNIVKMSEPDGRVDPRGDTLKKIMLILE